MSSTNYKFINYNLSLDIVQFLKDVSKQRNVKITKDALCRLTKFLSIFIRTLSVNVYFYVRHKDGKFIESHQIEKIVDLMLRGEEIDTIDLNNKYDFITNPLKDSKKSELMYCASSSGTDNNLEKNIHQLLLQIIGMYDYDGKITKLTQKIKYYIHTILYMIIGFAIGNNSLPSETNYTIRVINLTHEYLKTPGNDVIINTEVLTKISTVDAFVKLDKSLGNAKILSSEDSQIKTSDYFTETEFDEIDINDLVTDYFAQSSYIAQRYYPTPTIPSFYAKSSLEFSNLIIND